MNSIESLPPACAKLLHEKARRRLTFAQIAKTLGHDEVWTAALFYGRASPTLKDIQRLASLLNLSDETLEDDFRTAGAPERRVPQKCEADAVVQPFADALALYEPAIRACIVEKLGDGAPVGPTMKVRVNKAEGSSVRVELEAKYVGYTSW
ncbi:Cyanate hydratase [Coemansia sp. RSA 552]|nr:Cyanate hydratase [Coemansia sp. RSA 552]